MENVAVTDDELAEVERLIFTASGGGPSTFDRNNAAHGLLDYTKRLVAEVRASRGRIARASLKAIDEALGPNRTTSDTALEVRILVAQRDALAHETTIDRAEVERLKRELEGARRTISELADTLGAVDAALPPLPLGSQRRSYQRVIADVESICADDGRATRCDVVRLEWVVEEARRAAATVRRLVVAAESELSSLSLSPILRALLTLDERLGSEPSSLPEQTDIASLVAEARALCAAATPGPWMVNRDDLDEGWINYQVQQDCPPGEVIADISDEEPKLAKHDAALIARARTLIPEMADALELLAEERDDVRRAVDQAQDANKRGGR